MPSGTLPCHPAGTRGGGAGVTPPRLSAPCSTFSQELLQEPDWEGSKDVADLVRAQHPLTKGQPLLSCGHPAGLRQLLCSAGQSWGQSQPTVGSWALRWVPVAAGGTGSGLGILGIQRNACVHGRAALLFNLGANCCTLPCLSFPLGTRKQKRGPLSLPNACTRSHGGTARALQTRILPSSRCIFGLNTAFSLCIGFLLPVALPAQPRWGLSWLYVCWGPARLWLGRLGREPALEAVSSPSSCLRSRAPLRHCPTKSSAAVIAGKKKKAPQAMHAHSSSACNDCWVMDRHGDNFELLSALKPCSLLCAGDEMCWLPLPGSCFSLSSLAGERGCPGSSAVLGCVRLLNDPSAEQGPQNVCWGEQRSAPGVSGLPDGLQHREPEPAVGIDVALGPSSASAPAGTQPGCDIQRCGRAVTAGAAGPGVTAAG